MLQNCLKDTECNAFRRVQCHSSFFKSAYCFFRCESKGYFGLIVTYEAWTTTLCMSGVPIVWLFMIALIRFRKGSRRLRRMSGEHIRLSLLLCGEKEIFTRSCGDIFASFQTSFEKILQLCVVIFQWWMKAQSGHCIDFSLNTLRIDFRAFSMTPLKELAPMTDTNWISWFVADAKIQTTTFLRFYVDVNKWLLVFLVSVSAHQQTFLPKLLYPLVNNFQWNNRRKTLIFQGRKIYFLKERVNYPKNFQKRGFLVFFLVNVFDLDWRVTIRSNKKYVLQFIGYSWRFSQELLTRFKIKNIEDGKVIEIFKNTIFY